MFTRKIVLEKSVEGIPNAASLLPRRYKEDRQKIAAHTLKCNAAKSQVNNLALSIRDELQIVGLTQPVHFMRMSDTSQSFPGGKFTARYEFYVYDPDIAQQIFDVATKESPAGVDVKMKNLPV